MEFALSSDSTNNAYFDRIIQTQVDADLQELTFCLQKCKITHKAHLNPDISFSQRLCLGTFGNYSEDCTKIISIDISEQFANNGVQWFKNPIQNHNFEP